MRNNNIKSLLLEIIHEQYGKIEFAENSLLGKNHILWPHLQEYHDANSQILCLLSCAYTPKERRQETFQLAFEYNIVKNPLKVIQLHFDANWDGQQYEKYEFNYVKEIRDFARDYNIIHDTGMGPIEYQGRNIEGYAFWQEVWKGEKLYMNIRNAVKECIVKELDKNKVLK
jgi:hypothetical protein